MSGSRNSQTSTGIGTVTLTPHRETQGNWDGGMKDGSWARHRGEGREYGKGTSALIALRIVWRSRLERIKPISCTKVEIEGLERRIIGGLNSSNAKHQTRNQQASPYLNIMSMYFPHSRSLSHPLPRKNISTSDWPMAYTFLSLAHKVAIYATFDLADSSL